VEAESVSHIVCLRSKVQSNADSYLAGYLQPDVTVDDLNLYAILKAAGQVEVSLGLAAHTNFGPPNRRQHRRHE
jgi:hypothetical protein